MKIFLLRHEQRYESPEFTTNLTEKGLKIVSSEIFKDKIDILNIECIYSSPFVRCLQTIYFYCLKNRKIKLDNCLYEYLDDISFEKTKLYDKSYYNNLEDYKSIIDDNYNSIININELKYPENKTILNKRVKKFIDKLRLEKYKSILIVSHQSVLYSFLEVLNIKYNDEIKMGDIIEIEV
jgi:broad specificity phosphatase PhoE